MIHIDELIIEITRKCNLNCEHCLRGKSENINMREEYIDTCFKVIDSVNIVSISGGEPSLNITGIEYIIQSAKKHDVSIGNFYLATNGTSSKNEFISSLINFYLFCDDNEISAVTISEDQFHDVNHLEHNISKLMCLNFVERRNIVLKYLINEGSTKENNIIADWGLNESILYFSDYEVDLCGDNYDISGQIYLNCEGFIINNCDLSYKSQKEHQQCHVDDFKLFLDSLIQKEIDFQNEDQKEN